MNDRDRINRALECANEEQLSIIRRFVERYVGKKGEVHERKDKGII